ncbi:MAG: branched-chain amino acid ABC transporter permease, partial [Nitrospinaceae bacterium]|nr:branched-chain amino acid ABC transporter permease [Nitrospinaceae bacterium]
MSNKDHWRNLGILGGSVVLLLFVPPIFSIYIRSFFMFMMMYVVLSLSWNIISGYTGYISFGHVVFYGVGTYTTAILVVDYGWHWIGGLIAAGVVGVVYAILIGFPVLRLKGPYFAIAMLGAAEG